MRGARGFLTAEGRAAWGEWYGNLPPSTASINLQIWGGLALWRVTAGWVMIAALIASGGALTSETMTLGSVVLLWLLVDPLWGALWRLAGGRNHLLSLRTGDDQATTGEKLRLPYVGEDSPAAQLLSLDESNAVPWLVRIAIPEAFVALLVSVALGMDAVVATLVVGGLAAAGWTWRRTLHLPPLLLHSIVLVLIPWLLTLLVVGVAEGAWSGLIALALIWSLHGWGEAHLGVWGGNRFGLALLAIAEVALAILLIVEKAPLFVPVIAILFLPAWLKSFRGEPLQGVSIWWLAALLVSAFAIGL